MTYTYIIYCISVFFVEMLMKKFLCEELFTTNITFPKAVCHMNFFFFQGMVNGLVKVQSTSFRDCCTISFKDRIEILNKDNKFFFWKPQDNNFTQDNSFTFFVYYGLELTLSDIQNVYNKKKVYNITLNILPSKYWKSMFIKMQFSRYEV